MQCRLTTEKTNGDIEKIFLTEVAYWSFLRMCESIDKFEKITNRDQVPIIFRLHQTHSNEDANARAGTV